jgi:hypothetical protein
MWLKDSAVKVNALEFQTTPSDAAVGNVTALVNEGGVVKKALIYPFGQSTKDIYSGWWYYGGSGSTSVTGSSEVAIQNDGSTVAERAPQDVAIGSLTTPPDVYLEGFNEYDVVDIAMEITVTPASGFTTGYVTFGLDTNANGTMDTQMQDFALFRGASSPHAMTVHFSFYVTSSMRTNGVRINMKPTGADMAYSAVKVFISRTYKA